MPSYKDSPKPLRKSDPSPLFKEGDDGYVVKSENALQRQRREDGTQHSFSRPSRLEAKDYELFIGEEKIDKSVSARSECEDDIDPDEVVKNYMAGQKVVNTAASVVPTPDHK